MSNWLLATIRECSPYPFDRAESEPTKPQHREGDLDDPERDHEAERRRSAH